LYIERKRKIDVKTKLFHNFGTFMKLVMDFWSWNTMVGWKSSHPKMHTICTLEEKWNRFKSQVVSYFLDLDEISYQFWSWDTMVAKRVYLLKCTLFVHWWCIDESETHLLGERTTLEPNVLLEPPTLPNRVVDLIAT